MVFSIDCTADTSKPGLVWETVNKINLVSCFSDCNVIPATTGGLVSHCYNTKHTSERQFLTFFNIFKYISRLVCFSLNLMQVLLLWSLNCQTTSVSATIHDFPGFLLSELPQLPFLGHQRLS